MDLLEVHGRGRERVPESLWKFCFYAFSWAYSFRLLWYPGHYPWFRDPLSIYDCKLS